MKNIRGMNEQIHTVQDLITALGGTTEAAKRLGEKYPSTVSNWRQLGRIPSGKFRRHNETLAKAGIRASTSIWFGSEPEAAE